MSWFDSLLSGASDLFSSVGDAVGNVGSEISSWFGGGGGDVAGAAPNLTGGINPSAVNFDASSLGSGGLFDASSVNLGGIGSGLNLSPMDAITSGISGISPAGTPGGIDTSGLVASPSGGLSIPGLLDPNTIGAVSSALGGGSRTPTASPQGSTSRPTATGATGATGGSNGGFLSGVGSTVGSVLSNPAAIAGLISPMMAAINAKDQTNLGPDAAKLRTMADNNQHQIDQLSAEAQAEKVGNLPGPAMAALEASMAQQKASLASRYAAMGMSGSSAEGADMAALNQQNEAQRFNIGLSMGNEALSQVTGLQSQDVGIYQNLMTAQAERDQEYMQAMADLASGIGKAFSGPSGSTVTPASTPSTAGLTPSPSGGLPIPGLTDPNTSPLADLTNLGIFTSGADPTATPAFDASQAGAPQFLPSALTSYLNSGADLTNLFASAA